MQHWPPRSSPPCSPSSPRPPAALLLAGTRQPGIRRPRRPEHPGRLRSRDRPRRAAAEPGVPDLPHPGHHRRPGPAADGAGGLTDAGTGHPGSCRPRLERRQPAAGELERHPRTQPAHRLHQPVRRPAARHRLPAEAGCARPLHRCRAQGPLPRRGDHRGLGAGQRGDVPLAGRGPRRARLRRAHLRRAGPGQRRDAAARAGSRGRWHQQRAAVLQPVRDAAGRRAYGCPGRRPSSSRTSSSAPRTRSRSSPPPRPSTTPTRARRGRRSTPSTPTGSSSTAPPTPTRTRQVAPQDRDHRPLDGRSRRLEGADLRPRVATVVALDKLTGPDSDGPLDGTGNKPVVPALGVQSAAATGRRSAW